MKKITMFFSALLFSMMSFAGVVTFDADVDQGNAGTDSNNAAAYTITKNGVTVEVSQGILGTYNNEMHYRIYKNQTLTITSTVGNITSVELTCTANDDAKYGPGCLTGSTGDYAYSGPVGTWTGNATEITFTASTNQVRASQIVVTIDGEGGSETPETPEEPETPETPDTPAPEGVITCAEAVAICEATGATATTETYTIRGYVTEIKYVWSEQYGTATFWIADTKDGGNMLQAYSCAPLTDADKVFAVGAYVELVGKLKQYNTTNEVEKGTYTVITPADGGATPEEPETPETPETPEGGIVFDADVDQGNAGTDSNNAAAYEVEKNGVTMAVSSGILGTYNNEMHYRIYKNQTLVLTSTVGNITSVQFTCTANNDEKYGPGCFTVDGGDYTYSGAVGTWTGSAAEITFSAAANQVRATQIVVTIEGGATPTDVVNVKDLAYADAYYYEEEGTALWEIQLYNIDEAAEAYMMPIVFVGIEAKSKTSLNGTYDMLLALYGTTLDEETYEVDGVWNDETIAATLTIKNVDNDNNYSFVGTFVGEDGKTYKINTVANVYAEDDTTGEEIVLSEESTPTPDGAVTFDADVDQGNAGTDSNNATAYQITKSGVTMEVSSGILGTYNNEMHYRIYKNQTLTLTSTVGKIVKVEFTCTANDAEKYGPGCFTVDGGDYTYAGPVGTWTGSADAIVFTASSNQVRATQVVVTLESTGTGVEDVVTVEVPVKVIENGQLMIIRGENVYNVLGAQVK
ncbi:MAG: hypothetical protein J6J55_05010 [Paludibacteraceae bacterium]|nr:hypothetical protein [Paludibacteraceae bacterium]